MELVSDVEVKVEGEEDKLPLKAQRLCGTASVRHCTRLPKMGGAREWEVFVFTYFQEVRCKKARPLSKFKRWNCLRLALPAEHAHATPDLGSLLTNHVSTAE